MDSSAPTSTRGFHENVGGGERHQLVPRARALCHEVDSSDTLWNAA